MTAKFNELVEKLKEIFQIDKKLGAEDGAGELKIRQIENVFLEKMFEEK